METKNEEEQNGNSLKLGAIHLNDTAVTTCWTSIVGVVREGHPCLSCKDKCHGFVPHSWRKVCSHCKCPREMHQIESTASTRKDLKREEEYSWVPPGLSAQKIEEYFNQLPNHKVPRLGTPGKLHRDRQLMLQLPNQDLLIDHCKHVDASYASSFQDFITARNEIAIDVGYVNDSIGITTECPRCKGVLQPGDMCVVAPKFGEQTCWHPACFVCCECDELLVDLTYCVDKERLFCERHYAETIKPRCAGCDELIYCGEYTKAMNSDWHTGHFCCWQCDNSLTGMRYVLRDDHPFCIHCFEQLFANQCEECSKSIGIDSKDLSYKEKHWHESCFLCHKCRMSLVDKSFGSKNEKVYCANCYDDSFATRCDGCGEVFPAGSKKMEYKGRQWHEMCFNCCICSVTIGTKSFVSKDDDVYCSNCYEDKFSTRCVKCNKVITNTGITYKSEPWHRDCFTCTHCNNSLAGQRFTSRDEKPYCAECFGELFAKRCTACTRPITGIGGTRFISYEDRHWHNDCFICAKCHNSLVGKGFITDEADILCLECIKKRLV